jgi:hypothetical protein
VIASENATAKIVTVAIMETTKNLPETVIVRGENVKGRDHAVALVAVIVLQEDVDPDPSN